MRFILNKHIALIGVIFLGIGMTNATASLDCGDDDAEPITIHSATTTTMDKKS